MKKGIGVFFAVVAVLIVVMGMGFEEQGSQEVDFLRLHIRANSNSVEDQAVKYAVKQAVIDDMTPLFVDVTTRNQAMQRISGNLTRIQVIVNRVLREHGFEYGSRLSVENSHFPTRSYRGNVVPAGYYDALFIDLGAGAGDNWWCVIYPPLCFLDNNIGGERGVVYRSRLQEIIRRFF